MVGADSMKWGLMFLLVANLLMGCEAPQPYYYRGMNLLDVEFVFADVEHGTYPDTGILNHPTNPIDQALFAGKWDVEAFGYAPASYYVWATQLAVEATGDNQFYTAQALTSIYMLEMMDEYERYHVWQMAVNAHNALLEHFPDAVSYLADGVTYFPLAPLSYEALVTLGADVSNWHRIETEDGGIVIVPAAGSNQ